MLWIRSCRVVALVIYRYFKATFGFYICLRIIDPKNQFFWKINERCNQITTLFTQKNIQRIHFLSITSLTNSSSQTAYTAIALLNSVVSSSQYWQTDIHTGKGRRFGWYKINPTDKRSGLLIRFSICRTGANCEVWFGHMSIILELHSI